MYSSLCLLTSSPLACSPFPVLRILRSSTTPPHHITHHIYNTTPPRHTTAPHHRATPPRHTTTPYHTTPHTHTYASVGGIVSLACMLFPVSCMCPICPCAAVAHYLCADMCRPVSLQFFSSLSSLSSGLSSARWRIVNMRSSVRTMSCHVISCHGMAMRVSSDARVQAAMGCAWHARPCQAMSCQAMGMRCGCDVMSAGSSCACMHACDEDVNMLCACICVGVCTCVRV